MTTSIVILVFSCIYWLIIVALIRKKVLLTREIRQLREELGLYESFVYRTGLTKEQVLEAAKISGDQFWRVRASCAKLAKTLAEFKEFKRLTNRYYGQPRGDQS